MTAGDKSISRQVQALPYTALSFFKKTFFQTCALTFFLKLCVLQVSLWIMQVLQCRVQVLQFPMSQGDKHHQVYPAPQWDQCSPQTFSGSALPHSLRGRWCANLGDSLSPPPCWRVGCQQGTMSNGWWPCMLPAPSPPPLPPLCLLRGGSSSRGQFRVFDWDARSKIWFRFGGWQVLLISPAFWVWGFTRCWKYLWSHV